MQRPTRRVCVLLGIVGIGFAGLTVSTQVRDVRPVTDAMLMKPDPGDWLSFRRTLDGQGYSPLNQINRQNVNQLRLAWSWTLHTGTSEPTPLVSDGIMYLPNPGGGVQALDAANGDLLWDFRAPPPSGPDAAEPVRGNADSPRAFPPGSPTDPMRNLALYGDKVYTATGRASGARLIALNARTGQVIWDKPVGYRHTAGPIAIKGKVVISTNGCERYKKDNPPCFIAGFDAETGRELWRTSTIARPGEPGGDSWGDLPLMFRAGGDNWQAGSYDPLTNPTYWGTAQAKPWAWFQRGTPGDALYTNSTLALDLDTGKIGWYFQHFPADSTDTDESFERILVDYDGRSSVFSMGKLGILWENDRKTGAYRAARDLGYQTMVTVDPKTGRVQYREAAIPKPGVQVTVCPAFNGFKSWRAMAYHPDTQAFYIPLNLHCMDITFLPMPERAEGGGGVGLTKGRVYKVHPNSAEGLGEFAAMDIKTGRLLWRHRTRGTMSSAALTTGGGLVVVGDSDRNLYIHDVATGKILFQTRLSNAVGGFPITYAVRGRQYLAIPASTGSAQGWADVAEEVIKDQPFATNANLLYVFALPESSTVAR